MPSRNPVFPRRLDIINELPLAVEDNRPEGPLVVLDFCEGCPFIREHPLDVLDDDYDFTVITSAVPWTSTRLTAPPPIWTARSGTWCSMATANEKHNSDVQCCH